MEASESKAIGMKRKRKFVETARTKFVDVGWTKSKWLMHVLGSDKGENLWL